jgi:hypothetical protein
MIDDPKPSVVATAFKNAGNDLPNNPAFNHETIAELWRVYIEKRHGVQIAFLPEDVCMMGMLHGMALMLQDPNDKAKILVAEQLGKLDQIQNFGRE